MDIPSLLSKDNPWAPILIPNAPDLGPDLEREEMARSWENMSKEERKQQADDLSKSWME